MIHLLSGAGFQTHDLSDLLTSFHLNWVEMAHNLYTKVWATLFWISDDVSHLWREHERQERSQVAKEGRQHGQGQPRHRVRLHRLPLRQVDPKHLRTVAGQLLWSSRKLAWSWCYKTFFGGNQDFPKIKKLNKVCSADWTSTKMLKQCYFL